MQKITCLLLIALFVTMAVADEPFVSAAGNKYSSNRLIVKMMPGQPVPDTPLISHSKKLFLTTYVVYTDALHQLEDELRNHPGVAYCERDFHATPKEVARSAAAVRSEMAFLDDPFNDPRVGSQWSFADASANGVSINRAYKEKTSPAKAEIIVAVVDTGVDFNHQDLKDVMWKNVNEIPGNGIDDDLNGYADDIHGINTLIRDSQGNATVDVRDTHDHGTHVSGIIAATQNNNTGIAGIASKVKIMAIRTVPNFSDEKDVDVVEAFIYAAENGARIINCSFGKAHNEGGLAVSEAIQHIGEEYGVLVVAAAGNSSQNIDFTPTYPASFTNETLLVVASTTRFGSMSSFSNFGVKNVDVAAPGSSILSTVRNNSYSSFSGTSMASPTTAGVAAEVLAYHPNLTPVQLKEILMDSVTKVSAFNGKVASGGRVDLVSALEMAVSLESK